VWKHIYKPDSRKNWCYVWKSRKKGVRIAHDGKLIGKGSKVAKQYLKNNPDIEKLLEEKIKKIVRVSGGTVLSENMDEDMNGKMQG
jgi:hypothetical protein